MFDFLHLFTPYRNRLRVNYGRTNHSSNQKIGVWALRNDFNVETGKCRFDMQRNLLNNVHNHLKYNTIILDFQMKIFF